MGLASFFRTLFAPIRNQWNSPKRALLIIKTIIFIVAYTFMILNSAMNLAQPGGVPECLTDLSHEVTQPINKWLSQNNGAKYALIIISSLFVDLTVLICAATWIIYAKNMRLIFAVATYFCFKIFLQEVFYFRFPDGFLWEYPGFPSLVVPYYKADDFFFSAEIGLCMIALLEFRTRKMTLMKFFTAFTIIFECFVFISTRAHYVIDLTTGVVAGHYFYWVGTWVDDAWRRRSKRNGFNGVEEKREVEESKPFLA